MSAPGKYPIVPGHTRLTDALAMAKGLLRGMMSGTTIDLAELTGAFIMRDGRKLPVDFTAALLQGDSLNNIPLKNGDYIYIPTSIS